MEMGAEWGDGSPCSTCFSSVVLSLLGNSFKMSNNIV